MEMLRTSLKPSRPTPPSPLSCAARSRPFFPSSGRATSSRSSSDLSLPDPATSSSDLAISSPPAEGNHPGDEFLSTASLSRIRLRAAPLIDQMKLRDKGQPLPCSPPRELRRRRLPCSAQRRRPPSGHIRWSPTSPTDVLGQGDQFILHPRRHPRPLASYGELTGEHSPAPARAPVLRVKQKVQKDFLLKFYSRKGLKHVKSISHNLHGRQM